MERDKLAILTKVWWRYDGPEDQTSLPERRQMAKTTLERFRHELTTDYLDIVLLHCLTKPDWDQHMQPYMDVLQRGEGARPNPRGGLLVPRPAGDADGGRDAVGRCDPGAHQHAGRQRSDDGRLARRGGSRAAHGQARTARRSSA